MSEFFDKVKLEAETALRELLAEAKLKNGDILVIGCSTSEVAGGRIGKNSSAEAADAIFSAVMPILKEKGIYLAAQCCEHLNRALIVERECAEKYKLDEVCVMPQPHAGGSWATKVWSELSCPVAVESIAAHAGMDIGLTLIGMHLKAVAVPVRVSLSKIGNATITCARTRPKLIGGCRAVYPED
ncbi:MAG: TIGR01440 family protein [Eubacteriales bacterium]